MSTRVKIIPGNNETIEQAEENLYKALNAQRTGELHTEKFLDPAMVDLVERMQTAHENMYAEMMQEIMDELDKEYNDNI